jgi:hypothetical protein
MKCHAALCLTTDSPFPTGAPFFLGFLSSLSEQCQNQYQGLPKVATVTGLPPQMRIMLPAEYTLVNFFL